jgi:CSLREA domain-containing protein
MIPRAVMRTARCVVLGAVALVFAGATPNALAANFTVNTTTDAVDAGGCSGGPCTLRDAVLAANAAGGSSTITLPAGTYNLTISPSGNDDASTGDLNVTAAITINGAGSSTTIIDGGATSTTVTDRVFRVESTGSLNLSGATIQHGHPAGGNGTLSEGGGILAFGPLTLTDASVSNNFVETPGDELNAAGAGISQEQPTGAGSANVSLSLTRVSVSNNTVNAASAVIGGGGGLLLAGGSASPANITDSVISGNTAAGPGGAIYDNGFSTPGAITITNTMISSNRAALPPGLDSSNHAYGGGIATDNDPQVTLTNDTLSGNAADQSGGGIFDNGSSAYTITNTSIVGNTAVAGCTCGVDFVGGGGIAADGGNINPGWKLSGDLIALNTAGDTNHPNVPGGGIDEDGGDKFTIANTTIVDNTASGVGGGYEGSGGGTHNLTNLTIDGNRSGSGGGNVDDFGGSHFTFANTIVSNGSPANCSFPSTNAQPVSLGHNLDTGTSCKLTAAGDLANANPKLGQLGDNGGPTLTEALLSGSQAIDAGDNSLCPPTDQRGVSRPQNGVCDIGAYELAQTAGPNPGPGPGPGPSPSPQPPAAQPSPPVINTSTGATVSGIVNPENQPTTVFFQYGLDPRLRPPGASTALYDQSTPPQTLPADSADHPVSAALTGLVPHALYHVRLVASNSAGTTFGPDQTFTTKQDPPPPPPVLGKSFDVTPVAGLVLIRLPGARAADTSHLPGHALGKGQGFIPLTEARQLPSGTQVDARRGTIQLTSAAAQPHKLQTGTFNRGLFALAQDRGGTTKGLTTLSLLEGLFPGAPSYTSCKTKKAADPSSSTAHAAAVSSKVLQTLHASAHGRFRTRGRYAAATVRGTAWTMSDRCDGTLVVAQRDTVAVTDFVRHITVLVHQGHRFLARAARHR